MDRYDSDGNEPSVCDDSRVLLVFLILIVIVILAAMAGGCASSGSLVDIEKVKQIILEYKDEIPYDKIMDALEKIK